MLFHFFESDIIPYFYPVSLFISYVFSCCVYLFIHFTSSILYSYLIRVRSQDLFWRAISNKTSCCRLFENVLTNDLNQDFFLLQTCFSGHVDDKSCFEMINLGKRHSPRRPDTKREILRSCSPRWDFDLFFFPSWGYFQGHESGSVEGNENA